MNEEIPNFQKYFEELRVRLDVVSTVKKEIDRLVAPDFNLFELLQPNEVRLSNVIAKLLHPNELHGQSGIFLAAFLETIYDECHLPFIQKIRTIWAENKKNISVETEVSTATQRRMDILISGNGYGLMIENKPWADDQPDQLMAYREELEKRFPGQFLMIYLSGDGSPPTEVSLSKESLSLMSIKGELAIISYHLQMIDWLNRCLAIAEADRVRSIIKDFISYLENNFVSNSRSNDELTAR